MAKITGIEWTDGTLNTAWGCTKISEGCKNCYMYRLTPMTGRDPDKPTPLSYENLKKRLKSMVRAGCKVIFVNSMSDTFHKDYPFETIQSWLNLFEQYPETQFQILTKRIERAEEYFQSHHCPDNCWIGTSIESKRVLHRLDTLKRINTKIRFVSFEPLLEDLGEIDLNGLQWVIVGGESDFKNPRLMLKEWAENIRLQCDGIPFFFKQMGGSKKTDQTWGSDQLNGKTYKEMPIKLGTKESETL
jgi:protein gp37